MVADVPRLERAGAERGGCWPLRDATLAPERGQLTTVVGRNGAGKTTLLRLLVGAWEPDEGRAVLGDRALAAFDRRELARRVAYVPQRVVASFPVTVAELVARGRFPHHGPLGKIGDDDLRAIAAAMARVDVGALAERRASTLSGGELQRVRLARALASGAGVLVLDEPTASLDHAHALDVLALLRALADDGHAVIVALHDLAAAHRLADRVAVIDGGKLSAVGTPADVLDEARLRGTFGLAARWVDGRLLLDRASS